MYTWIHVHCIYTLIISPCSVVCTDTCEHTCTHKHVLCTHIHTHDPLPCHTVHQNTSLQHLPSARSCGYPILHSGTVPRWSLYQGSWHHPARWADWSYQLQSRHWKRQLRSQRSPADGISPGHPLQSRSHHTPSPRCCCSSPPPSPPEGRCLPPAWSAHWSLEWLCLEDEKKVKGEVKRKGKRLKKCGDEVWGWGVGMRCGDDGEPSTANAFPGWHHT